MSSSTTNYYSWQVCFWPSFFSFTVLMQYASIMSLSTLPILEATSRCPSFSFVTIVYCSRQSQASPRFLVNPDVGNKACTKVCCSHYSNITPNFAFFGWYRKSLFSFTVNLRNLGSEVRAGWKRLGSVLGPQDFPRGGSPPLRLVAEPPLLGPPPPHRPSLVPTGRGSRVTGRYSLLRRPLPRLLVTFLSLWVACWSEGRSSFRCWIAFLQARLTDRSHGRKLDVIMSRTWGNNDQNLLRYFFIFLLL